MCLFISGSKIYKTVGKDFQDILSQAKAGCRHILSKRLPIGEIWLERSCEQLGQILRFALAANKKHIHTFIYFHFHKALNRDQYR
jgi:hypothetical protein